MSATTLETLAGKLAEDTLAVMDETGDDQLHVEIGNVLGASSQSLEEAFLTQIRIRLAERKARQVLDRRRAEAGASGAPRE